MLSSSSAPHHLPAGTSRSKTYRDDETTIPADILRFFSVIFNANSVSQHSVVILEAFGAIIEPKILSQGCAKCLSHKRSNEEFCCDQITGMRNLWVSMVSILRTPTTFATETILHVCTGLHFIHIIIIIIHRQEKTIQLNILRLTEKQHKHTLGNKPNCDLLGT